MEENIYTITLDDGTLIEDLHLNGNNFISSKPIHQNLFEGNLETVIINDGVMDEVHKNMALVQIIQMDDEYWFILRDISENELATMKFRSDLDYLSMMTDIEF